MAWFNIDKFTGFETKADPCKIDDGGNSSGQNTFIFDGDRVGVRNMGYEDFGDLSSLGTTDPIKSQHVFRKRDGTNVMMASFGEYVVYHNRDNSKFEILESGYTSGQVFGYADYNINTDKHSYVYFGNAKEYSQRWNGAYAAVDSVTATTITKTNTTDSWSNMGFNNQPAALGDSTTEWTITNPSGTTFRYTWTGVGVDPGITGSLCPIGTHVFISAENFSLGNNVITTITALGTNYFEIVNATGVAEATKTTGTGSLSYDYNYSGTVNLGDSTTQWNITQPTAGIKTFRYTWNGVGTNPAITEQLLRLHSTITITASGMSAGNKGVFDVEAVSDDGWFEVTNASGVAEDNKANGTGSVSYPSYQEPVFTVRIGGVSYDYLGGAYGDTLTGVSASPVTGGVIAGDGVCQEIEQYPLHPKGNIYMAANNRLWIAGIPLTPQAVYFSRYGDPTDFVKSNLVVSSTADAPGIFNLGEGGGGVTDLAQDEGDIYIFKPSITYKAQLSDSLYSLGALKPFDGKSQTNGCATTGSSFVGDNYIYYITVDGTILQLGRYEGIDYPNARAISDKIAPDVFNSNFDEASGIAFNSIAYFALKSNKDVGYNDVVLVWDIVNQFWISPITGWNVSDFCVYDNELYFSSSNSTNIYKITNTAVDGEFDVQADWKGKQFDFGLPNEQKITKNVYIEGYISSNTTLNISAYFDEGGATGVKTANLKGTETDYMYSNNIYSPISISGGFNTFGFYPFGRNVLGSNDNFSDDKKFRVYLNKEFRDIPFYNLQVGFNSVGQNQRWAVTRIGIEVEKNDQPLLRKIMRAFKII